MTDLMTRRREMAYDAGTWHAVAEVFAKAAKDVSSVSDLRRAFGYLGFRADCDPTYIAVNRTLEGLAKQADTTFKSIESTLRKVIKAYEGAEDMNQEEIAQIKKEWHF